MPTKESKKIEKTTKTKIIDPLIVPVLALRDIVIFPEVITPLFLGREKSIQAAEYALKQKENIFLLTQKDALIENPKPSDLYKVGTLAKILQFVKLPDGAVKILVEGISTFKIDKFLKNDSFLEANLTPQTDKKEEASAIESLKRSVLAQFEIFTALDKHLGPEIFLAINQIKEADQLVNIVAAHLNTTATEDRQRILETNCLSKRLEMLYTELLKEIEVLQTEKRLKRQVNKQMEKTQREYYLNEQMKAIQKELGDNDDALDLKKLEETIKNKNMNEEATNKALSELKRLKLMGPMSAEAGTVRTYIDTLCSLPWQEKSPLKQDLKEAQEILDADHFGLTKIKERIVEFLAVQKRTNSLHGSILCFVGPPGVGKTSLCESIAKATGRAFVRASLGGMRDEAEIRGHRRTYVGSFPGKIIQGMKKAKTINPLFLLDEIDKLGADYRGDPASALLEVLDPAQNKNFNDYYLDVDYDLSNVMFITTANSLDLPRPLLDRMEIISISGYTEEEKLQIAIKYLIPKQLKQAGLLKNELSFEKEAILELIRVYTKEAGVRGLERAIASIARKVVKEIEEQKAEKIIITTANLKNYAGIAKYTYGLAEKEDQIGTTTGLAWTEVGGEVLSIEALTMPGNGKIKLTGKLGDVMKESAETAFSYIQGNHHIFGIPSNNFKEKDVHVHVPEGATPKDGPSAGVAMVTSLVSAFTGIPVNKTVAMTGEITLRGNVLEIGGLKEKLLAALRAGIQTVLIPKGNEKDLSEMPESVLKGLKIIPVLTAQEVLKIALTKPFVPLDLSQPPIPPKITLKENNLLGIN